MTQNHEFSRSIQPFTEAAEKVKKIWDLFGVELNQLFRFELIKTLMSFRKITQVVENIARKHGYGDDSPRRWFVQF